MSAAAEAVETSEGGTPSAPPKVDEAGLTTIEARRRLAEVGPNRLVPERRRSGLGASLASALTDPMVLLLLIAGPTYLALGDRLDAAVSLAALAPIVAIDLLLEHRAERALDRLKQATAPTAEVWRDGRRRTVPSEELVPGDLIGLQEGDVIPADGTMTSGVGVMVDESALTGESQPVAKDPIRAERAEVLAGTTVLSGRGRAQVTATGRVTRYGQIGTLVAGIRQAGTPLQQAIGRLFRRLSLVALGFCAAVVAVELARGQGWGAALIAGVSLGIAAVPEEFPMVFTLYLALGAWRLARDGALVRRLTGVETLGATTVICTDKTGTLTLGRMEVAALWTPGSDARHGDTLSPDGRELLAAAVLASEPEPFDPLEQAILEAAAADGVEVPALHAGTLIRVHHLDPVATYVSQVWETESGTSVFAKGAIESILAVAAATREEREGAIAANRRLAGEGMRVLAVADGPVTAPAGRRDQDERGLRLLGLVAFADPLRPGAADSLRECRRAGIRVIMITGDHPETAHAVADELGLPHVHSAEIPVGSDLDALSDDELDDLVGQANLFARARPEHKHRLVRALKGQGHVVAMTGDGINDAPALREAHVGVAMGLRGTEVAREAATLVLLDDDFSTIVKAVRDGRRIFENLRRAFSYLIAYHVPLLVGALLMPVIGRPLLLLPAQLILLELVLHPTIALVFENDPAPADLMRRRPRRRDEGMLSRAGWARPLIEGMALTVGVLLLYLVRLDHGASVPQARAAAFVTMIIGQTFIMLVERSPDEPLWRTGLWRNRALPWVLGGVAAILVVSIYAPPISHLLHLAPLAPVWWAAAVAVAAPTSLWPELRKARAGHT